MYMNIYIYISFLPFALSDLYQARVMPFEWTGHIKHMNQICTRTSGTTYRIVTVWPSELGDIKFKDARFFVIESHTLSTYIHLYIPTWNIYICVYTCNIYICVYTLWDCTICTYIHTCIHICNIYICVHTYSHTDVYAYIDVYTYIYNLNISICTSHTYIL